MTVIYLDAERQRRRRNGRPTGSCEACRRPSASPLCPACLSDYEALCGDSPWDHEACSQEAK